MCCEHVSAAAKRVAGTSRSACSDGRVNIGTWLAVAINILALAPSATRAQDLPPGQFSIYCTSNLDGTARCRRDSTGEKIGCVIIPGGVIACRDQAKRKYQCVQYGAIVAAQTQFVCLSDSRNAISDQLFDNNTDQPTAPNAEDSPSNQPPSTAPSPAPSPAVPPGPSGWTPQPTAPSDPNGFQRAF